MFDNFNSIVNKENKEKYKKIEKEVKKKFKFNDEQIEEITSYIIFLVNNTSYDKTYIELISFLNDNYIRFNEKKIQDLKTCIYNFIILSF